MKKSLFKEILVWLIIITGIITFSIFTYIIGANRGRILGTYLVYKSIMEESSGIYVGTKVTIHGRSTGNIVKMKILPNGDVEVSYSVNKKHDFIITKSSVIELKNSGPLGDRYINILTKDLSAPKLKKGGVIPYQKTSNLLSVLMGDGSKSKESIQEILTQVNGLVDQISEKGLIDILSKQDKKELSEILKHTKSILKKVDSGQGTLGALIQDRSLYNRLMVLLGARPQKNYLQDLSKKPKK